MRKFAKQVAWFTCASWIIAFTIGIALSRELVPSVGVACAGAGSVAVATCVSYAFSRPPRRTGSHRAKR